MTDRARGERRLAWFTLLLAAVAGCAGAPPPGGEALRPDEVVFAAARADGTPPAFDADVWRPVELPHDWNRLAGPRPRSGWYRAEVELDVPPDRLWAVYLPRVSMNAAVFLNGELLGDGGRFDPPLSRNWNRPLYFPISSGLLEPGTNVFHVRVQGAGGRRATLGALHVGPDEGLRPAYESRFLARVTSSRTVSIVIAVVAAFAAALWIRRGESLYGWFALAALLWALATTDLWIRDPPLAAPAWKALVRGGQAAALLAMVVFFQRLRGTPLRRLEWAAAAGVAAVALALLLAGDGARPPWLVAFVASCLGLAAWLGASLVALFVGRPTPRTGLVAALGLGILVLMAHDWLLELGLAVPPRDPVAHLGAPLLLAAVGWTLVSRFVGALEESETLNRELEARVHDKHAELEASYRQSRAMERERTLASERERIMRDMHDGMGGHLVSALSMVESDRTAPDALREILRVALEDMRLVIDSTDPVDDDLPTVLAVLRNRLEPRLRRHGLEFRWRVRDLPPVPGMSPERALQVLRVLQEALTNVVKHAGARTVTVTTGAPPGREEAFVEVCDDGAGIDPTAARGRGLHNMDQRARAVGGRLEVESSPGAGTTVRLWLSLAPTAPADTSFQRWLEELRAGGGEG